VTRTQILVIDRPLSVLVHLITPPVKPLKSKKKKAEEEIEEQGGDGEERGNS
jgi:hypothetical protein